MSSTSRLQSSQVQSTAQDLTVVTSAIARLRAEHDGASDSKARAILLHEIGVLEERVGDETASARDQLGAVNAEPEFREPLERLIAIIERRQAYKKLGRLLERLVNVADRPEERARALARPRVLLTRPRRRYGRRARAAGAGAPTTRRAIRACGSRWSWSPGSSATPSCANARLLARASLTENQHWRALLLLSLAEQRIAAGDHEAAERALEEAIQLGSPATFDCLTTLVELARKTAEHAIGVRAQVRVAEAIETTLLDAAAGRPDRRAGTPAELRRRGRRLAVRSRAGPRKRR